MGNSQAKEQLNQSQIYLNDVHQFDQSNLMFQSKLSSASYQAKLVKKLYQFNSSSQNVTSYIERLSFFGQYIECDNLMLPIYCYLRQTKAMCSEQKQLQIYHQLYNINIRDEIVARKRHYQKFTENQVWYLLYSILNACRKFEPYKVKSGNLKTNCIMMNQRGHVKVKNQLTEPEIKTLALPNFFSPEQLKNMRQNRSGKLHPNICQSFSIGIIILEICTFIDGQSFYDMYRMKINELNIERALEMVEKQKYSKLLINLLRIMLSGFSDRPLPSQIYLTFKPYEQEIKNLQGFKFDTSKIYESLHNSKASITSLY